MIDVRNVACELSGQRVLHDVSLEATSRSFIGLVGPNGAGKTTLLRLMSGTVEPTEGAVLVNGRSVDTMSRRALARLIAVVPQAIAASYPFTAFEVVLMGRHPYLGRFASEGPQDMEMVEEAMLLTDTWLFKDKPVTEISGGELQRVIIAQALAQDTPMLLLDEPTAHLDINHQLEILGIISRLYESCEKGIVLVSHDLNIAARYCKSLVLMDKGRLVSQGHVDEVLTPENIRNVYGLHALVKRHPLTGCIYTLPVSTELALERAPGLGRIHVVGGGGSASYLMRFLHEAGYNVSTGVVNVFDADLEAASLFGISAVVEAPFSPITPDSYKENLSLMVECCAVVVSETPFGGGNLLNLEAVLEAQRKGSIAVVLMNGVSITERDYTGGRATGLFQLLLDNGAGLAANLRVLEQILARVCPDSP